MPLRSNTSLAWNLPGIVAYYQPVRAPGSLLARYNMAHGGDNRYRATDRVAPTWSAATGWTSNSSQWLDTGITWNVTWTVVARWTNWVSNASYLFGCDDNSSSQRLGFYLVLGASRNYYNPTLSTTASAGNAAGGVVAIANRYGYYNGVVDSTAISAGSTPTPTVALFGVHRGAGIVAGLAATMPAFAIYARTLSVAEVWTVSRQMAYCDVNPDWSVWGQRRQWFYGPQVGGFQAAWARNANRLLGGGMN